LAPPLNADHYEARKAELRYKCFPVLDKGHVMLIDVMGNDHDIVEAARVSYGQGTRAVSDDRQLLRHMMRHHHTSPFEMVEFKFRIKIPMDAWRQMIRHRTASVNEVSTRYSVATDDRQTTLPFQWRLQSGTNKQGSSDQVADQEAGNFFSTREAELHAMAAKVYEERIEAGVAREVARKDLPLATYTEAYWKVDLHNLIHYLFLRMDGHAQQEIRAYANIIGNEIVAKLCPLAWEAFIDYKMNSITLSRLDIEVIRAMFQNSLEAGNQFTFGEAEHPEWQGKEKCRERDECLEKLKLLGLIAE
jgi:thymidylate synthase (FAD)